MQWKHPLIAVFSFGLFACSEQPIKSEGVSFEPAEIAFDGDAIGIVEFVDGPAAKASTGSCSGYHDGQSNSKWAAAVVDEETDACHEWQMLGTRRLTFGFSSEQW